MKIFLDDIRNPENCVTYMHKRIGSLNPIYLEEWVIARNYNEFVDIVTRHIDKITHISFDHDIAEEHYTTPNEEFLPELYDRNMEIGLYNEKTGYDCAKFALNYYRQKGKELPIIFVHTLNPAGRENITNLFKKRNG